MVILRTSARLSCRYCVEAHSVAALDAGLSPGEVRVLRRPGADGEAFVDPADPALLAWVDAVAGAAGPVDPGHRAALALMLNRFCAALALPTSPETLRRLAEAGLS